MKKGVFEKVSEFKHLIRKEFPEIEENELVSMIRELSNWHYKKKGILSQEHIKLYELMINNSYNPNTVYKWLLLARSPFELREKLKLKLLSQRQAFSQKKEFKTLASTSNQELLNDIIQTVERYIIR